MTQQMLIIFAIFADRAQDQSASTTQIQSVEAMAVFAFFLFFIYAVFGSMLAVFRDDIIKQGKSPSLEQYTTLTFVFYRNFFS